MQAGTPTMPAPTRKGGATNERRHYATRGFQGRRTVARTAERGCRRHAGPGGGGQLRRRRRHSRLGRPCRPVTWVGVARWWRRVRGRMPASGGASHERYRTRRYRHVRRSPPIHPSGPARSTRVPCEIERGPYTHAPEAGGIGSIAHDAPTCRPVQARAVSSRKALSTGLRGRRSRYRGPPSSPVARGRRRQPGASLRRWLPLGGARCRRIRARGRR